MTLVECDLCEEEFDPTEAGGWCTNCDKWQHNAGGGDTEEPDTVHCPGCGELVPEANYCTNCKFEFGSIPDSQTCQDCSETVPAGEYCRSCGAELPDVTDGGDDDLTCPSCSAAVDPDDSFCSNCAEPLEPDSDPTPESDPTPPTELVLEVMTRTITVTDGDVVGKEIRRAALDGGVTRDEVRKIHREHVEFERDGDTFYLIDHGVNDTTLNGESLSEGDRRPIEPGDEIGFHGVATATVREP